MVLGGGEGTETEIEGGGEAERRHPWWWWVAIVGRRSDWDAEWTLKRKVGKNVKGRDEIETVG